MAWLAPSVVGGLCGLACGDGVEDTAAVVVADVGDGGESDGGEEVVEVVVEVAVEVGGGGVHGEGDDHGENLWLRGLARSERILVGRLGRSAEIVVEIGDLVVEEIGRAHV